MRVILRLQHLHAYALGGAVFEALLGRAERRAVPAFLRDDEVHDVRSPVFADAEDDAQSVLAVFEKLHRFGASKPRELGNLRTSLPSSSMPKCNQCSNSHRQRRSSKAVSCQTLELNVLRFSQDRFLSAFRSHLNGITNAKYFVRIIASFRKPKHTSNRTAISILSRSVSEKGNSAQQPSDPDAVL